ncbi:20674_t:CDS:2 [Entrophospora sp. SA101]|nr:20674_t:CDS:2 [Entrophospora sp. SA101]
MIGLESNHQKFLGGDVMWISRKLLTEKLLKTKWTVFTNSVLSSALLHDLEMCNGWKLYHHGTCEKNWRTEFPLNTDKDLKFSKGNDVLLFPDNILIYNVNPKNALEFFKKFLLPSPSSTPQPPPSLSNQEQNIYSSTNFQVDPIPYKAVIVICSHRRRDKRCGITGPILKNEFDRILKDRGLDVENKKNEGVAVFLSSHKYAGNVIVYRDGQGIWYGHVIPCHVENIIESTVIEGKVIRDLYRGSMNGSFGPGKGGRLDW